MMGEALEKVKVGSEEKSGDTLLRIRNLEKRFKMKHTLMDSILRHPQQWLYAINDVSLDIHKGEILGLVGESGCGKTTLARLIIHLYEADGGVITLSGHDLTAMSKREFRSKSHDVQMIFQDPFASLNPRMTVREILKEVLTVHKMCPPEKVEDRILELMDMVGLRHEFLDRLPAQFSGGQRQRIGIARALAMEPKIILADEPVSALDVSIQAQIINLLKELRDNLGLTIIFISHDLSVVRYIADKIAVMYLGRIVELSESEKLFRNPVHPYAEALLLATPEIDTEHREIRKPMLEGEPPSPMNLPKGCPFATRCTYRKDRCQQEVPELVSVEEEHWVRCVRAVERMKNYHERGVL